MASQNLKLKIFFSLRSGFTLVETIVAFGLLLAALVGPVSLVIRGISGVSASKNKLIAAYLAEEGIELARAARDNNIICGDQLGNNFIQWNHDPGNAGSNSGGTGSGVSLNGSYELDADLITAILPDCGLRSPQPVLYTGRRLNLDPAGVYTYQSGRETSFSRRIDICSPPDNAPCNAVPDGGGVRDEDQMEIISEVFWTEGRVQKSFQLRERLYNWH